MRNPPECARSFECTRKRARKRLSIDRFGCTSKISVIEFYEITSVLSGAPGVCYSIVLTVLDRVGHSVAAIGRLRLRLAVIQRKPFDEKFVQVI